MCKIAIILLLVSASSHVNSHGRLWRPLNRSSVWRDPAFASFNLPQNYDDMQLWCGSVHQPDNPGMICGVCGDPLSQVQPRDNEIGGRWYRGIITERYTAGSVIEIEVQITAAHSGFMEFRLCTNPQSGETQACFNQHLLQRADGQGSRVPVDRGAGWYNTRFRLPIGVRCDHCVIQWNYRAGNDWGLCPNGTGALGCGPQETFRGCADVSIS
ncbi:uncharacterized protein LOC119084423 isoform X1 [Bradysia coprophila]|uniref:uncharacterized protein LOC119084423 isoform X1 n=2 Tax=Bradysia coprophila TaxID=38358 RepID=UPI00187DCF27|nr:uncharacterized protein LOC119084423 isoform X1 [Bradysia coprophila]